MKTIKRNAAVWTLGILTAVGTAMLAAGEPVVQNAAAPQGPGLTLIPPTSPEVALIPFDSAKVDPRFTDLIKQRGEEWSYFRPYMAVYINQSTMNAKAFTFAWTVTDTAGKQSTFYSCDQQYFFGQENNSVGPPGTQVLLVPSTVIYTFTATGQGPGGAANRGTNPAAPPRGNSARGAANIPIPPRSRIDEYSRAAKVTVEIDAVVFLDGHVIGPDRSRTVKNLEVRDAAARSFVRQTKDAAAAGEDIQALFARMAGTRTIQGETEWTAQINASATEKESDLFNFWMARMARGSQASTNPMNVIERIAQMAPLPRFFRETR